MERDKDKLILRYLEGESEEPEDRRVAESLASRGFRRRLAMFARDQASLHELTRSHPYAGDASEPRAAVRWPSRVLITALATAAAVAAAVVIPALRSTSTFPADAEVTSLEGRVLVNGREPVAGQPLNDGDVLRTVGLQSAVTICFRDQTRVALAGDSALGLKAVSGQKQVELRSGRATFEVSRQSVAAPMQLITRNAVVTVLGTEFALTASEDRTSINVSKGAVNLQGAGDPSPLRVVAGKSATVLRNESATLAPSPRVNESWSVDFHSPDDESIAVGQWDPGDETASGLVRPALPPKGLNGPDPSRYEGTPMQIATPGEWFGGLFTINEDTRLNFRVRMDEPEWYQIVILTRDAQYRQTDQDGAFEFQESVRWRDTPKGAWRTVSAPLSSFKHLLATNVAFGDRPVAPPRLGDVVFKVSFTIPDESRGFVLDRVWVSHGAAGDSPPVTDMSPVRRP